MSSIEKELNTIVIYVILIAIIICALCTILGFMFWFKGKPNYDEDQLRMDYLFYIQDGSEPDHALELIKIFTAFYTIFNTIIPISIMITLEVVKGLQVAMIDKDRDLCLLPDEKLKILSMKLQEDLGCVKYIFTDKTGTLTRNEMEFRSCSIFTRLFDEENSGEETIGGEKKKSIFAKQFDITNLQNSLLNDIPLDVTNLGPTPFNSLKEAVTEFFLNIALNHNVLTEENEYTGSSPDEVVLVQAAKELGIEFIERVGKYTKIRFQNEIQTFEVLHRFEYSSARARSSIIVKDKDGIIKLYMKGADTIILKRLNSYSNDFLYDSTKDHLDKFAKMGLRTLCYSMKIIKPQDLAAWEVDYKKIHHMAIMNKSLIGELDNAISNIETNTILLGVSALEDKLQDDVKNVLNEFIEAGINVWMLTGDKLDTAESIGYNCKMFNDDTEVFKIKATLNKPDLLESVRGIYFKMLDLEEEMEMFQMEKKTRRKKKKKNLQLM